MNLAGKILCRSVGTLGMGLALYDATQVGKQYAKNGSQLQQAKYLDRVYYNSRTLDNVSYTSNSIQQKTFDLRTRNPLPAIWGKIKGGSEGVLYALGNALPLVACSALALLGKNIGAKIGAAGVALGLCFKIARDGFGVGKKHPMN